MARSTPSTQPGSKPSDDQPAADVEPAVERSTADAEAAVEPGPAADAEPVDPAEIEPPPATVEPEPEAPPADADDLAAGIPAEAPLPDPLHLVGDRPCPVCEGAGTIPFGVLQSPRFRPCDECGGIGQVLTGSLKTESSVFDCPGCEGAGYKTVPTDGPQVAPAPPPVGPEGPPPWPGAVYDHVLGSWQTAPAA